MLITIGTGKNRKSFFVPSRAAEKVNPEHKIPRERVFEDLKSILFRPAVPRQILV